MYMLAGSCIWGTISEYQNGIPKVTREASNIGEVWNLVCCHGNQTIKLVGAHLVESSCKESIIALFAHSKKLNISGTKRDI